MGCTSSVHLMERMTERRLTSLCGLSGCYFRCSKAELVPPGIWVFGFVLNSSNDPICVRVTVTFIVEVLIDICIITKDYVSRFHHISERIDQERLLRVVRENLREPNVARYLIAVEKCIRVLFASRDGEPFVSE